MIEFSDPDSLLDQVTAKAVKYLQKQMILPSYIASSQYQQIRELVERILNYAEDKVAISNILYREEWEHYQNDSRKNLTTRLMEKCLESSVIPVSLPLETLTYRRGPRHAWYPDDPRGPVCEETDNWGAIEITMELPVRRSVFT